MEKSRKQIRRVQQCHLRSPPEGRLAYFEYLRLSQCLSPEALALGTKATREGRKLRWLQCHHRRPTSGLLFHCGLCCRKPASQPWSVLLQLALFSSSSGPIVKLFVFIFFKLFPSNSFCSYTFLPLACCHVLPCIMCTHTFVCITQRIIIPRVYDDCTWSI